MRLGISKERRKEKRMQLIIGGAYQGKAEYAAAHFGIERFGDFPCREAEGQIHLENFSRACVEQGLDAVEEMKRREAFWRDKVLIAREIGSGIVPMEEKERRWREAHGRMLRYLAKEAETVTRVFCGLAERLA